jgi:hypothetical protein
MNELKWRLGEPCTRSSRTKASVIVPEPNGSALNTQDNFILTNKREMVNEKMNERHMISQINQNPFLIQNKYLDDLDIQETFLKPKNSNLGYEKNL